MNRYQRLTPIISTLPTNKCFKSYLLVPCWYSDSNTTVNLHKTNLIQIIWKKNCFKAKTVNILFLNSKCSKLSFQWTTYLATRKHRLFIFANNKGAINHFIHSMFLPQIIKMRKVFIFHMHAEQHADIQKTTSKSYIFPNWKKSTCFAISYNVC